MNTGNSKSAFLFFYNDGNFNPQKQLGTTLHKSQQRIDQRIKKWQDLRQAVESVKVSNHKPQCMVLRMSPEYNNIYFFCVPSALCSNSSGGERADIL